MSGRPYRFVFVVSTLPHSQADPSPFPTDDDECELGRDNCDTLGPKWTCHNIEGSFRCVKKRCSYGEKLAADGSCIPIDCRPGYRPDQRGQCRGAERAADATIPPHWSHSASGAGFRRLSPNSELILWMNLISQNPR